MKDITAKIPWKDYMGDVPMHLDYFEGSMFEAVEAIAKKYPEYIAFDFMGKTTKYKDFRAQVHECAKALKALGIKRSDKAAIKAYYDEKAAKGFGLFHGLLLGQEQG